MTATEAPTTELVKFEALNAVQIFTKDGLKGVLDGIEAKVRAIPLDVSTVTGRDEIRSVAYKIARTKTLLDAEGKKLTEEWRNNTAKVNTERKVATERLDALAEEIRKPLTDFENRDKIRIAAHEAALSVLSDLLALTQPGGKLAKANAVLLDEHLLNVTDTYRDRYWEEFTDRATRLRADGIAQLTARIEDRRKYEADQAELERLRKLEVERLQREHDERLKAEAAEKARVEAERVAKETADKEQARVAAEAERVRLAHEREQKEAADRAAKAEADRIAAEKLAADNLAREARARKDAEQRAVDAESARVAAEQKAEVDRQAAARKAADEAKAAKDLAKKQAEAAAQRERDRIAKEQADVEAARLKREADAAHVAKIRSEALEDLLGASLLSDADGAIVIDLLMAGHIRHVKVSI